jgi:hypothetical protein
MTLSPGRRARLLVAVIVAGVALATANASIRSPDAEVVYRTAEALALRGSFAVERDLDSWAGFGLPTGRDGRKYAIFGPLLAMVEAPVVRVVDALVAADAPTDPARVQPSYYYGDGLRAALWRKPPDRASARGHLVRSWVTLVDVVVLVLIALATFELALRLAGSIAVAWLAGLLLPLGTLLLPYTTCLFSEPLAVLLTLVGIEQLAAADPQLDTRAAGERGNTMAGRRVLVGGLALGLASTAHISAVLALPFMGVYAAFPRRDAWRQRAGFIRAAWFIAGAALPLALLGVYNCARFGDPLETGRNLQTGFGYGTLMLGWKGLVGLTVSWGKGLVWYCPLAVLALLATGAALRAHPVLAATSLAAFAGRLLFIATRSDWHAGFCLGPRYLLLGLPFVLVLPLLAARGHTHELFAHARRRAAVLAFASIAILPQLYFVSGEVFQYLHARMQLLHRMGSKHDLYFDFELSPLSGLLDETSGPYLFRFLTGNTLVNWALLSAAVIGIVVYVGRHMLVPDRGPEVSSNPGQ